MLEGWVILVPVVLMVASVLLLDKGLTKWLKVDKKKSISDTPGKKMDRWGRGIIFVAFLGTLPFFGFRGDPEVATWYWGCYMIVVFGFQSYMEWRYIKSSRQHLSTLIFLVFMLLTIILGSRILLKLLE